MSVLDPALAWDVRCIYLFIELLRLRGKRILVPRRLDMGAKQRQDQGTGRGEREEYRMDKAPVHGMEGEPR